MCSKIAFNSIKFSINIYNMHIMQIKLLLIQPKYNIIDV